MSQLKQKSCLILCEGKEDQRVFESLLENMNLRGISCENYQGKDQLRNRLHLLKSSPEFTSGAYQRILITRDADNNWDAAWQSASDAVQNVFGSKPTESAEWIRINENTELAVWICPGNQQTGMIETLCLNAAKSSDSDSFACLDQFIDCINSKHQATLHEKEKFAIWSIAAQDKSLPRQRVDMKNVLKKLPFDWNSSEFNPVREILLSLDLRP